MENVNKKNRRAKQNHKITKMTFYETLINEKMGLRRIQEQNR